jgi:serine/threonine-protein kinase
VATVVVPVGDGGLAWRALDSRTYPWLPVTTAVIWGFATITCAVISWVIYGLRAEVREARRLGQYVLEESWAKGNGGVYRAHHGMMRRPSAIKLLRPDRAGEINLRRFEREVQLTARLTHPNTITIFDYGRTYDGVFYYAMELLDGATLQRVVAVDGAQPPGRVVRILTMMCGALTEAHGIGLIHRDIKPANIMLCTQGGERDVVKLLDFGLVKEFEVDRDVKLTAASIVVGTPSTWLRSPSSPRLGRRPYRHLRPGSGRLLSARGGRRLRRQVDRRGVQPAPPPGAEPLSARGLAIPAELDASCSPASTRIPTAGRRAPPSCGAGSKRAPVEPWDSARALAWWHEYQSELDRHAVQRTGEAMTIAPGS